MPTSTHLLVRKKSAGAHGRLCGEHADCSEQTRAAGQTTSRFNVKILREYTIISQIWWHIVKLVSENKTVDILRCGSLNRLKCTIRFRFPNPRSHVRAQNLMETYF